MHAANNQHIWLHFAEIISMCVRCLRTIYKAILSSVNDGLIRRKYHTKNTPLLNTKPQSDATAADFCWHWDGADTQGPSTCEWLWCKPKADTRTLRSTAGWNIRQQTDRRTRSARCSSAVKGSIPRAQQSSSGCAQRFDSFALSAAFVRFTHADCSAVGFDLRAGQSTAYAQYLLQAAIWKVERNKESQHYTAVPAVLVVVMWSTIKKKNTNLRNRMSVAPVLVQFSKRQTAGNKSMKTDNCYLTQGNLTRTCTTVNAQFPMNAGAMSV